VSGTQFKTGSAVISDFLASKKDSEIDSKALAIVKELFETKKLTRTQLLRALEKSRASNS
jgi:hypothetical protein